MNDEERPPRSRQDPRRDGGPPSSRPPAPSSTRAGERSPPPSSRFPGSARGDELAGLYRKIADLQTALAESDTRLERALRDSAAADEMVGQMLARVSEVEARLHHTAEASEEAGARAERAEEQVAAMRGLLDETRLEADALHAELAISRRETEAARADAEARCADLEVVENRLLREQEERETLSLRVVEFAKVCEERDGALLREELLEVELNAARGAESGRLRSGKTAELLAGLEREEAAAAQNGPARELAAARAERDALAFEVRHLRMAMERVGRALTDLDRDLGRPVFTSRPPESLAQPREPPPPPPPEAERFTLPSQGAREPDPAPGASTPAPPLSAQVQVRASPEIREREPRELPSLAEDDEEATKLFGRDEMELVRRTARTSDPDGSPR